MLISTSLPNEDERSAALAAVPWWESARNLSTEIHASYQNGALDLIDASIGPDNHCRAALVALFDGANTLLHATTDLAESAVRQKYFSRVPPLHPYTTEPLEPKLQARVGLMYAAHSLENAAVRIVSAGDHLANAHVRLAWEANATTLTEVKRCGFNPSKHEPRWWINVGELHKGLKRAQDDQLGVLAGFAPNEAFLAYASNDAVANMRRFRGQVVHEERPRYRELPVFGRTSLWTQGNFTLTFPPNEQPDQASPTLDGRRQEVGQGIEETLRYAETLWAHATRWLRTIDVWITRLPGDSVAVDTQFREGTQTHRFPRESRDPGPFLRPHPGEH